MIEMKMHMTNSLVILPLFADVAVPMIALTFPAMLKLLIPIIVVEGLLCKKWLGLTTWEAMKSNAVSNLVSTIVGVPVAWAIMLGVEFATIGFVDWIHPNQDWNSPIAKVISFFVGSAWIGLPNEKSCG
jgi:hypothetical protein